MAVSVLPPTLMRIFIMLVLSLGIIRVDAELSAPPAAGHPTAILPAIAAVMINSGNRRAFIIHITV